PRDAQLLLHHGDDLGLRQRRHLILESRELLDELGRQQVGTRREDLAELREGRAELLERRAQAARAVAEVAVGALLPQPVLRHHAADVDRAAEQPPFDPLAHVTTCVPGSCDARGPSLARGLALGRPILISATTPSSATARAAAPC